MIRRRTRPASVSPDEIRREERENAAHLRAVLADTPIARLLRPLDAP